jgi:histidyl-tRNA synthetase
MLKGRDLNEYSGLVGDSKGLIQLLKLMNLSKSYGFNDWLVFDPCVVRGLSYYTGIVFEGFDRQVYL